MQEKQRKFNGMPTGSQVIVIDGVNYTVVSHYAGEKDVDCVIRALAEQQATADMDGQNENRIGNKKISA